MAAALPRSPNGRCRFPLHRAKRAQVSSGGSGASRRCRDSAEGKLEARWVPSADLADAGREEPIHLVESAQRLGELEVDPAPLPTERTLGRSGA